jgi:hypothetical protein
MSIDLIKFPRLPSGWTSGSSTSRQPSDEIAETKTRVAGLKLLKQFDDLKSQGLASLATLLNFAEAPSESDRTKTLLRGFERAARLGGISNEIQDWDGVRQIDHIMDDIVAALATIDPRRTLLVPLLDHDNARIRILAGRYLIDLMPDRVIPILEKIDKEADGSSDGFSAFLVLQAWEIERRGRFNAIEDRVVRG